MGFRTESVRARWRPPPGLSPRGQSRRSRRSISVAPCYCVLGIRTGPAYWLLPLSRMAPSDKLESFCPIPQMNLDNVDTQRLDIQAPTAEVQHGRVQTVNAPEGIAVHGLYADHPARFNFSPGERRENRASPTWPGRSTRRRSRWLASTRRETPSVLGAMGSSLRLDYPQPQRHR